MILWAMLFLGAIVGSGFGYWQGCKDTARWYEHRLRLIRRYGRLDG